TISIPRCTGRCAADGRDLEPGEAVVVVLTESADDEALVRTDYSLAAWERDGLTADAGRFASWKAHAPHPDKKQDALISADGLMDLFEQLEATDDPKRLGFRYVLALQLMRKRALEYVGARDGVLLVKPRGAEEDAEPIEVIDPQSSGELDEAALADLAEQVELLMDTGDES
ncbi:MAG: hypothetical protein AAFN41_00735, partial [Planctomycetota bacterium]